MEDEPAQKVMIELRRRHYPEPWGRPAQGEQKALEATTIADIRRQFQRYYRPNGTILGVAGRFDWPRLKDLVGELFGDWPPGQPDAIDESPAAGRYQHLPYDSQQTQIGIAYDSVPYRASRLFPGVGRGGRAERRHERPAVHRGPRAPRPVLQRLRHAPHACWTAAPCSATPAPAPIAPSRRWT